MSIESIPEEHRQTIRDAIEKRYPEELERILEEGYWDGLSGYFGFYCNGMFHGCETDGHIHT